MTHLVDIGLVTGQGNAAELERLGHEVKQVLQIFFARGGRQRCKALEHSIVDLEAGSPSIARCTRHAALEYPLDADLEGGECVGAVFASVAKNTLRWGLIR